MKVVRENSWLALLALLALLAPALSCGGGGTSSPNPDAAAGGDGGGGADASGLDAGPDAAGTGGQCGGFAGIECEGDLWCDFDRNSCGGDDALGTCRERPEGCTEEYQPVCGCDGEVYGNACMAQAAGTDVNKFGGCEAPAGTFECGYRFCTENAAYCRVQISDVATLPDGYDCIGTPAGCSGAPDCGCLAGEPCGQNCETDDDGNPTLTCPGG